MKRIRYNPLPAVGSMLDSCPQDEVDFFFISSAGAKSICVYPTSNDSFAAKHAVEITDGSDAALQAALIGLVHLHNRRIAERTLAAARAFIRSCTAGFYFGDAFGEGF